MVDIEAMKGRIERNIAREMPNLAISPVELRELIERLESAEARCAELQSQQDDYDRAHAWIDAAERDAARYRFLRERDHQAEGPPAAFTTHLGCDPFPCGGETLDAAIDAELVALGEARYRWRREHDRAIDAEIAKVNP